MAAGTLSVFRALLPFIATGAVALGCLVFSDKAFCRGTILNYPASRTMVLDTPDYKITFDTLSEEEALHAVGALRRITGDLKERLGLSTGGRVQLMLLGHGNFILESRAEAMKSGKVHIMNYGPPYEREAFPPERILAPPLVWTVISRALSANPSAFGRSISQSMLPMWIFGGAVSLELGRFSFLPFLNLAAAAASGALVPYDTLGISAKFFRGDFRSLSAQAGGFMAKLLDSTPDGAAAFRNLLGKFSLHPYGFDRVFDEIYRDSPRRMHRDWANTIAGKASPLAKFEAPLKWEKVMAGEGFSPRLTTSGIALCVPVSHRHFVYDLTLVSGKERTRLDGPVGRRMAKAVAGTEEIIYYVKFNEDRDGNLREDIFKISLPAGKPVRVTSGGGFIEPSVSPDGKVLVAVMKKPFASALVKISAEGVVSNLTGHFPGRYDFTPAVSPDGSKVAFVRYEGETSDLFVVPLGGDEEPERVTMDRGLEFLPEWTGSDGISISVLQDRMPVRMTILRRRDGAGREIRRTFETGVPVLDADFSAGETVVTAFTRDGAGVYRIKN